MRAFSHILHRFPAWPKHYNYEYNFIISPFSKCSCCCCDDFVFVFAYLHMNMYRLKLGILFSWWSIEHPKHTLNNNTTTAKAREKKIHRTSIELQKHYVTIVYFIGYTNANQWMLHHRHWHYTHFCGNLVKCKCWYKSFNMLHNPTSMRSANARPRSNTIFLRNSRLN